MTIAYKKVDDHTLKITTTKIIPESSSDTIVNHSRESLLEARSQLVNSKASIDVQIQVIDTHIAEAIRLGVSLKSEEI